MLVERLGVTVDMMDNVPVTLCSTETVPAADAVLLRVTAFSDGVTDEL